MPRDWIVSFWSRVKRTKSCWLWQGKKIRGYGALGSRRNNEIYAHRISWTLTYGSIPVGLNVLHRCDVHACVNPAHLWLGTQQDNIADMDQKGRRASFRGALNPRWKPIPTIFTCRDCKQTLPLSYFYIVAQRHPSTRCKSCYQTYSRNRKIAHAA